MNSSEQLNNAIYIMGQLVPTDRAQQLATDWSEYWSSNMWRSLGPLGEAFTAGTELGFWKRYQRIYRRQPSDIKARLAPPSDVSPRPVDDSVDALAESGQATAQQARNAARAATSAAKRGVTELRQAVSDVADRVQSGVEGTAYSIAAAAGAIAVVIYLIRK